MATRVVIAEDEAIIRLDLKETLEEEGYEVVGETGRGDEAVKLVRELEPDLAILDIKMPGLDGLAAAREIVAEGRSAVLILTAFSQRDLIEQALCITQRSGRVPGDHRFGIVIDVDILGFCDLRQVGYRGIQADSAEIEALTAADNRLQEIFRVCRGQHELRMGWWFFQRLEERISRGAGDLVGFVDDVELRLQLGRGVLHALTKITNVIDTAIAGGIDLNHVSGRTGRDRNTASAFIARSVVRIWMFAVHCLGKNACCGRFTSASWPAEQVCVRNSIERNGVAERVNHVLLSKMLVCSERLRAVFAIECGR